MMLQTGIKRRTLVDVMNCIRKMNSYTTSFTGDGTFFWKKIEAPKICKRTIKWGQKKQDIHVTC